MTEDSILSTKSDDIIAAIAAKAAPKKKPEENASASSQSIKKVKETLKKIRENAVIEEEDEYEDEGPQRKKAKKEECLVDDDMARAEVFSIYEAHNNNELKDVLRWNRQLIGGNKDALLTRIIDGHMHGRLGRCPMCKQGKVKLAEDGGSVFCNGYFDEDTQVRLGCSFKSEIASAPRLDPWYTHEPTEEESMEMDSQDEAAKTGIVGGEQTEEVNTETKKLMKLASGMEWNISSPDGMKKAAKDLLSICKKKLALPEEEKRARMQIGKIIAANRTQSATEVLSEVIFQVGYTEVKKQAKKRQQKVHESLCAHSSNTPIMEAFMEMAGEF